MRSIYYPEVEQLLRKATGAAKEVLSAHPGLLYEDVGCDIADLSDDVEFTQTIEARAPIRDCVKLVAVLMKELANETSASMRGSRRLVRPLPSHGKSDSAEPTVTDRSAADRSGEPQELSRVERQNLRFVGRVQSKGANFLYRMGETRR